MECAARQFMPAIPEQQGCGGELSLAQICCEACKVAQKHVRGFQPAIRAEAERTVLDGVAPTAEQAVAVGAGVLCGMSHQATECTAVNARHPQPSEVAVS